MHLHQVLTGAVNPGDNCYSVGSVGDFPFTVSSRTGASCRAASDGPTHAPSAQGLGGGTGRVRNHRPRLPGERSGGGAGRLGQPGGAVLGACCSGQSLRRFPPAPG